MSVLEEPEVTPWPPCNTQSRPEKLLRQRFRKNAELFGENKRDKESKYFFSHTKPLSFGGLPSTRCVFIYQQASRHTHDLSTFPGKLPFSCVFECGFGPRRCVYDGCDVQVSLHSLTTMTMTVMIMAAPSFPR